MTIDRTLKQHGGLVRTRSVLTRGERIERLKEEGLFNPDENSPLGLPKVRVRTTKAGSKAKKEAKPEGEAAAAGAAAAPAAEAPKGGKAAKGAKGGKK